MQSKSRVITIISFAAAAVTVAAAILLCVIFPNKYAKEINAAADEFGLSRTLVRSVVWAESKFDSNALSDKGAAGLMQLMPETFKECKAALGIQGEGNMFDPKTSLRCGCYYLSKLLDKFDGDERAALMAYNAGEANARRFLSGEEMFGETAGYLESVAVAKKVYGLFT